MTGAQKFWMRSSFDTSPISFSSQYLKCTLWWKLFRNTSGLGYVKATLSVDYFQKDLVHEKQAMVQTPAQMRNVQWPQSEKYTDS